MGAQLRVAVAASVLLLGMPHGALDFTLSGLVGARRTWASGLAFLGVYAALGALVVGAWQVAPSPTLVAFLLLSVVHFGLADVASRPDRPVAKVLLRGSIPIVVPLAWHPVETGELLALLAETDRGATVEALDACGPWMLCALVIGTVWVALRESGPTRPSIGRALIEPLALGSIFVFATPLVAFTVYFCGWHSTRHLDAARRWLTGSHAPPRGPVLLEAGAIWLAAIGLILVLGSFVGDPASLDLDETVLRAMFIGLGALTLPHVLLVDGRVRPMLERRLGRAH
ncbi:MAG: Brp/Blh family beta-carotene 15,15'-dioxygenase [Planctomycetota bacterium]